MIPHVAVFKPFEEGKPLEDLPRAAKWLALLREGARSPSGRGVSALAIAHDGRGWGGVNIHLRHRTVDVHAEVMSIAALVAARAGALGHLLVLGGTTNFEPCPACLDLALEAGGPKCYVSLYRPDSEHHAVLTDTRKISDYLPLHRQFIS